MAVICNIRHLGLNSSDI